MKDNRLTLLEYGFGTLGHSRLMERIARSVEDGRRIYLIVPEQQTVVAESEFSEYLAPSAALNFEVTNFTRFSDTVFRSLGGLAGDFAGGAVQSLLMWRTLTEIAPMLTMTRGSRRITPGIVARATSALSEARAAGFTPDEISRLEKKVGGGRLRDKLSDLSLILSAYEKISAEGARDLSEAVSHAAARLASNPEFLSGTEIFIDGFTSFTAPQMGLIGKILSVCPLTLTLPLPRAERGGFEFREVRLTLGKLLRLAESVGAACERIRIAEPDPTSAPIIREAASLLFRTEGTVDEETLKDADRIRIFEAATPFEECDFIAADIKRRVMAGQKYSDFAIITRSAEDYSGILDTALSRVNIPHFVSRRRGAESLDGLKLIRLALRICAWGFRREWVIGYAKCPVSGITPDECDLLESYMERWQIDGAALYGSAPWRRSPGGYDGGGDADILDSVNGIKERILSPLRLLSSELGAGKDVRDMAASLVSFLDGIGFADSLARRAAELRLIGSDELADATSGLAGIITDALDTLVSVMGDTPVTAEEFSELFAVAVSEAGISRIPAHADEITVGQADVIRMRPKSHVYLIGVNEGSFPRTVRDDSYFTESDKQRLMAEGADISPELEFKSSRELLSFLRAFTFAGESVTLSYTVRSAAFAPTSPSSVIHRLSEISAGAITPTRISSLPVHEKIYSPDAALLSLGSDGDEDTLIAAALTECGMEGALGVTRGDISNDTLTLGADATGILYRGDLYLSQSRIDAYLRCPMLYFCRYNLKLSEGEVAELDNRIIGTFIHGVLESFFIRLRDGGLDAGSIGADERRKIAEDAAAEYVRGLVGETDARQKITVSRLCRAAMPIIDGLCREFAGCEFKPRFFELNINNTEADAPRPVEIPTSDGGRVVISGTMDRLDTYRRGEDVYVRVVDYKTGAKEFDPRELAEGRNLQMFLYLKSVTETDTPEFRARLGVGEGGQVIPAGVIYVKTRVDDTTVESAESEALAVGKKLSEREGMVLLDEESLSAQNPEFLPVRIKDGEVAAASLRKTYTREGWGEVDRVIREAVDNIATEIKSGNIAVRERDVRAFNSPCESCAYKPVCRTKY